MIIEIIKINYKQMSTQEEGCDYMKLGYIRVSSTDQNEARQLLKMQELGVSERFTFVDKKSGKDFNREAYNQMKTCIRAEDLLYIDALDRLGRNYDEIIAEWKEITLKTNADIICLDNPELFNSRKWKEMGDIGKVLQDTILALLAYVADTERKKILQRQKEGIAIAKQQGKYKGRKRIDPDDKLFKIEYARWKSGEQSAKLAMQHLKLKPNTFYRRVKEYESGVI